MNIIGKWNVLQIMAMNADDEFVWVDEEGFKSLPAYNPDDPDSTTAFHNVYQFAEDGDMVMMIPLPDGVSQEDMDDAVASGEVEIVDGMMVSKEGVKWKEEDGEFAVGMDLGDGMHWEKIEVEDDSTIRVTLMFLAMRLTRA